MTRVIAESPFIHMKTGWKKPQTPLRAVPTEEQFQAIVHSIRCQRFTDHAQDSADSVEFLELAGLGQAEASALRWADIDWANERFSVRRQKTGALFFVPIYPDLRPLLERMKQRAAEVNQTGECSRSRMPRMPIRC